MKATDLMHDAMALLDAGLEHYILPHCRGGLREYIVSGVPVGDFLHAVLSNDFMEVVARADDANLPRLHDYMLFLSNHAPSKCWGSEGAYRAWRKQGGLAGLVKED